MLGAALLLGASSCEGDPGRDPLDPAGTWLGSIPVGSVPYRVIFNLERDAEGRYGGTLDNPEVGALAIPLTRVEVRERHLEIRSSTCAPALPSRWGKSALSVTARGG